MLKKNKSLKIDESLHSLIVLFSAFNKEKVNFLVARLINENPEFKIFKAKARSMRFK